MRLVLIYTVLVVFVVLGTFVWLRFYTNHGDTIELPDMVGKSLEEAQEMANNVGIRVQVIDSVYDEFKSSGEIVLQTPSAYFIDFESESEMHRHVKVNRKVYVTITRKTAPIKKMIDLVNKSKRIGLIMLEASGLKSDQISYKPSSLGSDIILAQLYNGENIKPGDPIRLGDKISLVVSESSQTSVPVPNLIGLNLDEAQKKLNAFSLNLGVIVECDKCFTGEDTAFVARVYDQRPNSTEGSMSIGGMVSLYLTLDESRISEKDTLP